jgi:hypothetical protein
MAMAMAGSTSARGRGGDQARADAVTPRMQAKSDHPAGMRARNSQDTPCDTTLSRVICNGLLASLGPSQLCSKLYSKRQSRPIADVAESTWIRDVHDVCSMPVDVTGEGEQEEEMRGLGPGSELSGDGCEVVGCGTGTRLEGQTASTGHRGSFTTHSSHSFFLLQLSHIGRSTQSASSAPRSPQHDPALTYTDLYPPPTHKSLHHR